MQIKYDNITSNNELEKFIPFNIVLLAQELPLRGYQANNQFSYTFYQL